MTPDWTVTGPVGGDDLARLLGRAASLRAAAPGARRAAGAPPPLSMTTRRLRAPGPLRRAGGSGDSVCSVQS